MAEQDLLRIAQENVDAFNAGDWDRMRATLAPDSVYEEFATQRRIEGADKVTEANQGWKTAFPDAKGTVTSAMATGNMVVQEITWAGTNTGPMEGPAGTMPATGKPVEVRAVMISTFAGDKIKEARHYFDLMGMMQQLGAVPTAAGAAD
jgi:steroid delta-isomerase-like uncharacterized protein